MPVVRRKRNTTDQYGSDLKNKAKNPKTRIDFLLDDLGPDDKRRYIDEVIDSEDEDAVDNASVFSSDSEKETIEAKKIRLAREYLQKIEEDDTDSSDASSSEHDDESVLQESNIDDLISKKLEKKRLKQQGIYERFVVSNIGKSIESLWDASAKFSESFRNDTAEKQAKLWVDKSYIKLCRGHELTPTCVALLSTTGSTAYSASKDNSVLMWDVENETHVHTIVPRWNPNLCNHTRNSGEVLAMAVSDDGRYLATGGRDYTVKVYDVRQKKNNEVGIRGIVTTFEGHKGPVNALAFKTQSLQLFSGSDDRCIRHYNLEELAYIETLYGHQAAVTGISSYGIKKALPFSVARDRTARAWKLEEETHMIYRGGSKLSNADCISAIKDDWFLTGHDDGVLSLWLKDKKRPVSTVLEAHGKSGNIARSITCCSSLGGSDFAATGSNDGYLRLWNVMTGNTNNDRGLEKIGMIPVHGYINDVAIGPKGRFCVAAIGQEPRLGRWDRVVRAKNRFAIIQLWNKEYEHDYEKDDDEDAEPESDDEHHLEDDDGDSNAS